MLCCGGASAVMINHVGGNGVLNTSRCLWLALLAEVLHFENGAKLHNSFKTIKELWFIYLCERTSDHSWRIVICAQLKLSLSYGLLCCFFHVFLFSFNSWKLSFFVFFLSTVLHVTPNKMRLRMRKASQRPNLACRPLPARTKRKHSDMECSGETKGLLSSIKNLIHGNSIKVSLKQLFSFHLEWQIHTYRLQILSRSRSLAPDLGVERKKDV